MPRHGGDKIFGCNGICRRRPHGNPRSRGWSSSQPNIASALHDRHRRRDRNGTVPRQRHFRSARGAGRNFQFFGGRSHCIVFDMGAWRNDRGASRRGILWRVRGDVRASLGGICDALFLLVGTGDRDRQRGRGRVDLLPTLVPKRAVMDVDRRIFGGARLRQCSQRSELWRI
jgi:hypothetical protein